MGLDLTQTPPQGHFTAVNGIQMYYEVYGQGTPLILLHGYTNSSRQWQPFIAEFAKHFQIIVPDLRGHGRSVDPTKQFTLAQAAQDTFVLLDQLGVGQFRAIGDSAGSCMLQYMASQQPNRPQAIVLLEGGSYFPEQTRAELRKWAKTPDADLGMEQHLHLHGISQMRPLLDLLPQVMDDYKVHPPDLSAIRSKTLLVFGDRDELYPLSVPMEMYAALANACLWIVPNAHHAFLVHETEKYAESFIHTALKFLQDEL